MIELQKSKEKNQKYYPKEKQLENNIQIGKRMTYLKN